MPQSRAKNSWKNNFRSKPFEVKTISNSAGAKLKNIHLEEDILTGTQKILKSKIRRRASFEWEIKGTKEEANDLKFATENLSKINGECIKIVTNDRPKPTIIFIRPESTTFETLTFPYMNENERSGSQSKEDQIFSKETKKRIESLRGRNTYEEKSFIKSIPEKNNNSNTQAEDSILTNFNPTKFTNRKVQSAKFSGNRWKKLYENSSPSDVTIDRRQKLYRPFTAGSFTKVAEKQARTKSQLSVILNSRFPAESYSTKKEALLNENNEKNMNLQRKVEHFCEDIEHFKRKHRLDCDNYIGKDEEVLYDNNLERLLRKLKVF